MDKVNITQVAEELMEAYRSALLIDPFVKITIDIGTDGDFISKCYRDKQPLSWVIKINPDRHSDVSDIQYSIIQSILEIIFSDMDLAKSNDQIIEEMKLRIIARLTTAISMLNIFDIDGAADGVVNEED